MLSDAFNASIEPYGSFEELTKNTSLSKPLIATSCCSSESATTTVSQEQQQQEQQQSSSAATAAASSASSSSSATSAASSSSSSSHPYADILDDLPDPRRVALDRYREREMFLKGSVSTSPFKVLQLDHAVSHISFSHDSRTLFAASEKGSYIKCYSVKEEFAAKKGELTIQDPNKKKKTVAYTYYTPPPFIRVQMQPPANMSTPIQPLDPERCTTEELEQNRRKIEEQKRFHGEEVRSLNCEMPPMLCTLEANNDKIKLWDYDAREIVGEFKCPKPQAGTSSASAPRIVDFCFAPTGLQIACALSNTNILIFDVQTPIETELAGHAQTPLCVTWSDDNSTILSGGNANDGVFIWNGQTLAPRCAPVCLWKNSVQCVAVNPQSTMGAAAGIDRNIHIFAIKGEKAGTLIYTVNDVNSFTRHIGSISCLQWLQTRSGSAALVSGSSDNSVKIWMNNYSRRRIQQAEGEEEGGEGENTGGFCFSEFNTSGLELQAALTPFQELQRDAPKSEVLNYNHEGQVTNVAVARDLSYLAAAVGNTVCIWKCPFDTRWEQKKWVFSIRRRSNSVKDREMMEVWSIMRNISLFL